MKDKKMVILILTTEAKPFAIFDVQYSELDQALAEAENYLLANVPSALAVIPIPESTFMKGLAPFISYVNADNIEGGMAKRLN